MSQSVPPRSTRMPSKWRPGGAEMDKRSKIRSARVVSRRNAVALLGSAGLGIVAAACRKSASSTATTAGSSSTTAACVLQPEVTEGPYYLDLNKVRGDITEGRPGAALDLQLTVVDATRCTPIKDRPSTSGTATPVASTPGSSGERRRSRRADAGNHRHADVPAGRPAQRRQWRRGVPHDLPGLVSRPRGPYPPQGPHRRGCCAHRAAVLR